MKITATIPFDAAFSADKDEAAFMKRAQNMLVRIGCPDLNDKDEYDVDEIMSRLDLQNAGTNERGYQVPVRNRACAVRLLAAGFLDQTGDDIIARWNSIG